jgi:hypothetical protein
VVADSPRISSDGSPSEETKTPTSARVAILVMWIMAGLLLANAALTVVALDALVDRATSASGVAQADARRTILIGLVPPVLLGVLLGLAAWGLARRHAWGRWIGLGAAMMLFALTLLTMLAAGGLLIVSLLLLLLSMAAATSLLSRTTAQWIPRLRSGS